MQDLIIFNVRQPLVIEGLLSTQSLRNVFVHESVDEVFGPMTQLHVSTGRFYEVSCLYLLVEFAHPRQSKELEGRQLVNNHWIATVKDLLDDFFERR